MQKDQADNRFHVIKCRAVVLSFRQILRPAKGEDISYHNVDQKNILSHKNQGDVDNVWN